MNKILLSVAMLALIGVVSFGATRAFFSDTETSAGNVFAAGSLDLEVGIENRGSLAPDPRSPISLEQNQALFSFGNLIPGDSETGHFKLESSQDAWACLAADITSTPENTRLQVEADAGDASSGGNSGELQNFMEIAIWEANQNNVDGVVGINETDTLRVMSLADFANGDYYALQDSVMGDNPLMSGTEEQYEFAYCFGEFSNVTAVTNSGGTLECDGGAYGSAVNQAQTDSVLTTLHFYAEQMENNADFVCGDLNEPVVETQVVGANFSNYSTPSTCDANVGTTQSIQAAIDGMNAPGIVCVASDYSGAGDNVPIHVNETGVKLMALTHGVELDVPVVLVSNDTGVSGFTLVTGPVLGETAGVYVSGGVSGYEVSFNDISLGTGTSPRGVLIASGGASGGLVANNILLGLATGVYSNNSATTVFEYNDFTGNNVGLSHDAGTGNIVRYNEFSGNSLESVGVGVATIVINYNNILDGVVANYAVATLDATNNWWGAGSGTQTTATPGPVDVTPEAVSVFPQN